MKPYQIVIDINAWKAENDLLETRAKRGNWGKFQKVLAKVRDIEPEEYDKL